MAARMYTPKLCSSIARYSDTRSALARRKVAPIVVNRMIIGYSGIDTPPLDDDTQGIRMRAPVTRRNTSIFCVRVVAWISPLNSPSPASRLSTDALLYERAAA